VVVGDLEKAAGDVERVLGEWNGKPGRRGVGNRLFVDLILLALAIALFALAALRLRFVEGPMHRNSVRLPVETAGTWRRRRGHPRGG
jgi:hypothetical protein